MQQPMIEMCSASIMHRLDVQWTVKEWQLIDDLKSSKRSNSFKLYHGDCYLELDQLQSDKNKKILNVFLTPFPPHETATVKSFCFYNIGQKHELEKSDKGKCVNERNSKHYRSRFIVDEKALNKNNKNIVFYIELSYIIENNEANVSLSRYLITEKLQKTMSDDYDRINKNEESLQQDNITFIIGSNKIQAHSIILASVSPYFAAMLRHENFKENKERIVNLTDDSDVTLENFQIFLDILYDRKGIQNISIKFVTQICVLADKYNVKELLEPCELILSRTLSTDNVTELLLFADKYNCEYLKMKALFYAKANIHAVKQSPNFDALYENKTVLMQLL